MTLYDELKNIENLERNNDIELYKFKRISFFSVLSQLLCLIAGYLFLIIIAYLIVLPFNDWEIPYKVEVWYLIIFMPIWPGILFWSLLENYYTTASRLLKFKLSRLDRIEYEKLRKQKISILDDKISILTKIRNKEISEKKEIDKQIEGDYLKKILSAVSDITNRRLSFQDAKQLQLELMEGYAVISNLTYRYHHTDRFFRNRLSTIAMALDNYGNLITPKVEPFTKNYVPIAKIDSTTKNEMDNPERILKPNDNIENFQAPSNDVKTTSNSKKSEQTSSNNKEKSIEELFPSKKISEINQNIQKRERQPVKVDYIKLNEQRKIIGILGEEFAFRFECKRLKELGLNNFIDKVIHVSASDDSHGYDIKSINEDGSERYIEVKTTTDDHKTEFFLSENEKTAMNHLDNYFIYRIYNFDIKAETGQTLILQCPDKLQQYFEISAVSYKVSPK